MAAALWYIAREGHKIGPFSVSQMRQLAMLGLLQPAELVWTEGLSKWVAASTFPALFPAEGQKRYWLNINGETRGPFGADQVRSSLIAKEINLDALVCPENGKDWLPLNRMTEFVNYSPPAVSPSQAKLLSGTMGIEEARLHMAGKSGDAIAKLISTLLDLQKAYADNPGLVATLEKSIAALQAKREQLGTMAGKPME